jgi:hypothetical protein
VEKISAYLSDTPLSALLEARYSGDKPLMASLLLSPNKVLEQKGERKPTILLETIKATVRRSSEVLGVKPDASPFLDGGDG